MKGEYLILASIEGVDDLRVLETEHGTILFGKEAAERRVEQLRKDKSIKSWGVFKAKGCTIAPNGKIVEW